MNTRTLNILLNSVGAVGLTVGGASAIPGCNIPSSFLFYGLLLAGVCKAVSSTLVQASGQSDEAQGISPAQIAAAQAVHDLAKVVPPATPAGNTPPPPSAVNAPPAAVGKISALLLPFLFIGQFCHATSVTNGPATNSLNIPIPTNLFQVIGASPATQQFFSDFGAAFVDAQPYFTNDIAQVDTGVLYNNSLKQGKFGTFLDFNVPTTQQMSVGFGGGYIGNELYDCTVNLKLGTTVNYWLVGKCYSWVASGPDYNLSRGEVGAYNFAGVIRTWDISPKWKLSVGPMVGNISTLPGVTYGGSISVNYHW